MKLDKFDFVIAGFLLFIASCLVVGAVSAHEYHNIVIQEGVAPVNIINSKGTALALAAAQHNFDMGTFETQVSVAMGSFDGSDAASVAIGKRMNDMLINGSIGSEGGKAGFGVGLTFRF